MSAASIIASVITGGSNSHQTVAEELNAYATDFVTQGVVGTIVLGSGNTAGTGGFACTQDSSPDMGITVLAGVAYVTGTPSGQDSQCIRARMTSNYTTYTINANSSGSTKYDWIYLQLNATNANNPDSAADNVINLYTSRSSSNSTDNGSPPTYGLLLAVVTVANGAVSITNGNISDRRASVTLGTGNNSSNGWSTLPSVLTYSSNNGNKEFVLNSSIDLTGSITPGMRFKMTRSTVPSTQCMAFVSASSQSATKSSPSGMTFTGNFTAGTWIKLLSYPSATVCIEGRDSAGGSGSGFEFGITSTGQLSIFWRNGSGTSAFNSYQSVPLNTWVHIAGVATVSTPTAAFYINGLSIPGTSSSTSATSIVQASTNFGLGKGNNTTAYLNAYLDDTFLFSTALTSNNIQSYMTGILVGSETNIVGLWKGAGNFTDSTSNANNLTANNGAIATQADNSYNATEYGIITAVSSTQLTVFTGDVGTIPNATIQTPYYSTVKEPYGFPVAANLWSVYSLYKSSATATGVAGTWASITGAPQLSVPVGSFIVGYNASARAIVTSGGSIIAAALGISTAQSGSPTLDRTVKMAQTDYSSLPTNPIAITSVLTAEVMITLSSQTIHYVLMKPDSNGTLGSTSGFYCSEGNTNEIYARCAYL